MQNIVSNKSGLLWILSFFFALNWFHDYQFETLGLSILILFAWSYGMFSRGLQAGLRLEKAPVLILAGLFWLLVFASVFWSEVKPISLVAACIFSLMPLTFFAGALGGTRAGFKRTGYCLAVLFAGLSVWAIVQFFFLNAYLLGQARLPLSDPSSLGALFSLALFCSLGWVLADRPRREHVCAVALSILLVCGIMSTVARGPVFAFVPGIVFFLILLFPQVKARGRSLLLILVAGVAFFGLMQTGVQKRLDLGSRVFGTVALEENFNSNRMQVWKSTAEMIKDRPVAGTGIGTFSFYYPQYRSPDAVDTVYLAHNDPLQFWAELGVLGPLLFYVFVIAAALRSFHAFARLKDEAAQPDRIVLVSIFSALVAMVVQSHVSFNHYNPSILMITGFLLSVWFAVSRDALAPEKASFAPTGFSYAHKALLAMPFLFLGWLVFSLVAGEYFANRARDALFKEQMFEFADNINNAGRVSHGLTYRAYLLAVNVPMSILQEAEMTSKHIPAQQQTLYEQVAGYMQNVLAVNPLESSAYYYLGKVQTLVAKDIVADGTPSPEEYYNKTLALNPMHLGARMALMETYQKEGKGARAMLDVLEPGLNFVYVSPMTRQYYEAATRLYLEVGDYEKANVVMARMVEFDKRSSYSSKRQATSIPQAITGGDALLNNP